ncbi:MAG TPA: VOC family protein [Gemmatimonadota bacterium]|nr:VOC family protein [Gemmatimonadota bacterium]
MKPRLLHTMVRVKDLERSVRFYTEVLGLREQRRKVLEKADATLVFLSDEAGHHAIELTYNHDGRDYELGNQFGHFALGVPDLEGARIELETRGVEFSRGPYRVSTGGSMIAFIRDPDGIEIELIETR